MYLCNYSGKIPNLEVQFRTFFPFTLIEMCETNGFSNSELLALLKNTVLNIFSTIYMC